jgi:hypothetical protein
MALWPKLAEVRALLRLQPDPNEDAVIQTALSAAIDVGNGRLNFKYPVPPNDDGTLPDAAHEACLLHAARLYRRRDSLDGTIGFGDLGAIRVGRLDPDVEALYSTVASLVFG